MIKPDHQERFYECVTFWFGMFLYNDGGIIYASDGGIVYVEYFLYLILMTGVFYSTTFSFQHTIGYI